MTMTSSLPSNVGRALPGPPQPPHTRKIPATDQRQTACTHTTVTRLYDTSAIHRCQMCRRVPNIGWVYHCTQDHDGFLPETEFVGTAGKSKTVNISKGEETWTLSQWVYQAVLRGQYTVEQFSTLYRQRQEVKNAIFAQHDLARTPSTCSNESTISSDLGNSTTSTSLATSFHDENSSLASKPRRYQTLPNMLADAMFGPKNAAREETDSMPAYSACSWTCCQTCRPTYRDRAWQSLDAILNEPYKGPPSWELSNRRISDTRIVAAIGSSKYVQHVDYESSSEIALSNDSNLTEPDTNKVTRGALEKVTNSKHGFRATVRKAINVATTHARASSRGSRDSRNDTKRKPLKRSSQSMLFLRTKPSQLRVGRNARVMEDGQLQESLVLMIATNTPLPAAAAEDLREGEVEIEGGVAVTEEGVFLSSADIIMQV